MWVYDVPGLCPTIDQNFKFSLKKGFALRWYLCFQYYDHHHIRPHKLCQLLSRDQSRRGNMSSYSICSWRLAGRTAARFNIIKIVMRSVMMIMRNNMRWESCFDDGSFVKVSAEAPSFRTKHEEKVVAVLVTSLYSFKENQGIPFEWDCPEERSRCLVETTVLWNDCWIIFCRWWWLCKSHITMK